MSAQSSNATECQRLLNVMDKLQKLSLQIRRCQENSGPLRCADDVQEILNIMVDLVDTVHDIGAANIKVFQDTAHESEVDATRTNDMNQPETKETNQNGSPAQATAVAGSLVRCRRCAGRGRILDAELSERLGLILVSASMLCPDCNGSGKVI
jgi:hypothetical protein